MMVPGPFGREGGFFVHRLRQLMLAELRRRSRTQTTIRAYLQRASPRCRVPIRAMLYGGTAKRSVGEPV
jgi:hypothetical protein